jgi:hypothetical protein
VISYMSGGKIRHEKRPHAQVCIDRRRELQNMTAEDIQCLPFTEPSPITELPAGALPPPKPWLLLNTFFQRKGFKQIAW